MFRSYTIEGVILKRRNLGEADRVVTVFSKQFGKLDVLAKGVRRINSRRAGSLEPATQSTLTLARGKTFDLVTEARAINSFGGSKTSLGRLTQVNQVLEIVDLLTRENQEHTEVYELLLDALKALSSPGKRRAQIVYSVKSMVEVLGFGQPQDDSEVSLKDFIESVAERELKTKKLLLG